MNPNDPEVSRGLAKLQNTLRMDPYELMDLARGAESMQDLRRKYAKAMNLNLRDVPKLP